MQKRCSGYDSRAEIGSYLEKKRGTIDALEWLAAMCSHVPIKGEQMIRYYGYYSNVSRGRRKKESQDERIPCILESDESLKACRKNWARFIRLRRADPENLEGEEIPQIFVTNLSFHGFPMIYLVSFY